MASYADATNTSCPPVIELPVISDSTSTTLGNAIRRIDDAFQKAFPESTPSFYVRTPGRVNLIGEHIDYCGYAVLPMAIEQCIVVAVGGVETTSDREAASLTVVNTDPAYQTFSCDLHDVKVERTVPRWYNYILAGFLGIHHHLKFDNPKSMKMVIDGSIPPSAGLSSSSALVCAAALATAHMNGCSIPKLELASICAKSERYVGTEGGGMDQAICFLGEEGTAKLIEFNPLKASDVTLPRGYVFVIANSLADINKAATSQYNERVVECRLATKVLAKSLGLASDDLRLLGKLQTVLGVDASTMANKVQQLLHVEPYSKKEVCELLNLTESELAAACLNQNTLHMQEFQLYQRALHVYTESQRVIDFKKVCDDGRQNVAEQLGTLMNESHASCRDLYDCSHPHLDELVNLALQSGAIGSRLTGAGWGGCSVSLVSEDNVKSFLAQISTLYYAVNEDRKRRLATSLFPSAPASGAAIFYKVKA